MSWKHDCLSDGMCLGPTHACPAPLRLLPLCASAKSCRPLTYCSVAPLHTAKHSQQAAVSPSWSVILMVRCPFATIPCRESCPTSSVTVSGSSPTWAPMALEPRWLMNRSRGESARNGNVSEAETSYSHDTLNERPGQCPLRVR